MRLTTLSLAITATLATALPASADVFGHWLTEKVEGGKQMIVEITPCGASACGNIAWMSDPLGDNGQPQLDINNVDDSLKSRTLCGAAMIGDFTKDGEGKWSGGFIYAPDDGETYKSLMRLTSEGNLYVKGYIGIALFGIAPIGRSQVWTRADGNRGGC